MTPLLQTYGTCHIHIRTHRHTDTCTPVARNTSWLNKHDVSQIHVYTQTTDMDTDKWTKKWTHGHEQTHGHSHGRTDTRIQTWTHRHMDTDVDAQAHEHRHRHTGTRTQTLIQAQTQTPTDTLESRYEIRNEYLQNPSFV